MHNTLKEKLAQGKRPLGTFVGTGSAAVVECLGCAGLDFVILDNEHSPVEAETTADMVRAAELRGVTPLARVREISRPAILKLLDVGVQGLIIPDVHSVEDVRRIVRFAKYAPVGQRGFCPSRKDGWGTDPQGSVLDTMALFNAETLAIPQCETAEALADIEATPPRRGWTASSSAPLTCPSPWACPAISRTPSSRRRWSGSLPPVTPQESPA